MTATLAVPLPDDLGDWLDARARAEGADPASYVADLVRRDRERLDKIAHRQRLVDEAEVSGFHEMTLDELRHDIRRRAEAMRRADEG